MAKSVAIDIENINMLLNKMQADTEDALRLIDAANKTTEMLSVEKGVTDATISTIAQKFQNAVTIIKELPDHMSELQLTLNRKSDELQEAIAGTINEINNL